MFPGSVVAAPWRGGKESLDLRNLKDDALLSRFFQEREEAAFAVLMDRYAPLVYGVCRRVLSDANDAEDAFQATFLVLVRKGGTLRDPGRLASWLYGVAHRTARKLRAKAALRTKSERQASAMPTNSEARTSDAGEMTLAELRAVLDEEIAHLPEKYALPLVLCYLEGKTNAQAAEQLGWPEGSISRRLSRARELLRSRLARRGLALSAALIASVFARQSPAAVPHDLLATTVRAATLVAQGVEIEDVVSPAAAKLVQDVLGSMSAAGKFTIPTILVIASMLLVITTAVWQFGSPLQAASLLNLGRGQQPHALTGPTTGGAQTLLLPSGGGEGGCGSAPAHVTVPIGSATPASEVR